MRLQSSWQHFLPVAVLLAGTAVFLRARNLSETIPPHVGISSFPEVVSVWQGRDVPMAPNLLEMLGPGEFLMRDYQRLPIEPPVTLFLAYFPTQRAGDTIHSPKNCLPGSGWTWSVSDTISVNIHGRAQPIEITRYIVSKGAEHAVVLYWYQSRDRVVASEYQAAAFTAWDALRYNRTDTELVRVVTPVTQNGVDFIQASFAKLQSR